ncbi:MAG: flagellar assembly protein FliW [Bacteroidota bacterium]
MKINSRDFGEIEINNDDIVEFPKGIPGFLKQKEYVFLPLNEESPFVIMQSVNKGELAFVTIEPGNFFTDYEFDIDENNILQ